MIDEPAPVVAWIRRLIATIAVAAAGWWLFADTYAHYHPSEGDHDSIRFTHFGSYQDYELWRGIIDSFENTHSGVRVRQEYVTGWYGQYDTKLRQQILSGTLADVVQMQLGSFAEVASHFAEVTDLGRECDTPLDPNSFDSSAVMAFTDCSAPAPQWRSVPIMGGSLLIYCNRDCFAGASRHHGREIALPGDDWTMDDFVSTARDLTYDEDGDGRLDRFGLWLPRWLYYLPFVWSFGAQIISDDGRRWAFTGPEAESAVAFYHDLAVAHRVCPTPAEVPQLIQDVGFLTGRTAMCVNGPWFEPFLAETRLRDGFTVVPIPRGPAGRVTRATWDALCIRADASAERRAKAWEFVRYCAGLQTQSLIAHAGRALPALRSALPEYVGNNRDRRRAAFVEALAYSRLQPQSASFVGIDRAIDGQLRRFISDEAGDASAFLSTLAHDPEIVRVFDPITEQRR